MMDTKPIDYTTPRANPSVNCGLWVIMMHSFIGYNKCSTLVGDATGEDCA